MDRKFGKCKKEHKKDGVRPSQNKFKVDQNKFDSV